jgi:hypothetical protein
MDWSDKVSSQNFGISWPSACRDHRHARAVLRELAAWGNFHQHFWHQNREAYAFNGNSIWQKCAEMWYLAQKL